MVNIGMVERANPKPHVLDRPYQYKEFIYLNSVKVTKKARESSGRELTIRLFTMLSFSKGACFATCVCRSPWRDVIMGVLNEPHESQEGMSLSRAVLNQ